MSTIGQHISNLRGLLLEYGRTPESFTDQFLYEILNAARTDVLNQKLKKNQKLSFDNYSSFCVELELVKATRCECVPVELICKVLRTKYKIPSVLNSTTTEKLYIQTLSGESISVVDVRRWMYIKDSTEMYGASFIDGYIYFWNLPHYVRLIELYGLFADPTSLSEIPNCNPESTTTSCYDINTASYPLEEEFKFITYQRALQLLQVPTQLIQDITNDGNRIIKN